MPFHYIYRYRQKQYSLRLLFRMQSAVCTNFFEKRKQGLQYFTRTLYSHTRLLQQKRREYYPCRITRKCTAGYSILKPMPSSFCKRRSRKPRRCMPPRRSRMSEFWNHKSQVAVVAQRKSKCNGESLPWKRGLCGANCRAFLFSFCASFEIYFGSHPFSRRQRRLQKWGAARPIFDRGLGGSATNKLGGACTSPCLQNTVWAKWGNILADNSCDFVVFLSKTW